MFQTWASPLFQFTTCQCIHVHFLQMFLVGWCVSNHYALRPPKDYVQVCQSTHSPVVDTKRNIVADIPLAEPRSTLWCFNYQCFPGRI